MLFSSRHNYFLKLHFFLLFSNQGVKLIVLNTPRCYLQLHGVASSPSHICTTPSCTNLPLHMSHRARRLQWLEFGTHSEIPWRHSTGKKYCSIQHLNLCLELPHSKEKYNEDENTSPQIQLPHFFFPVLRSVSCSPCCGSVLLVLAVARWALFLNLNALFYGTVAPCILFNASFYSFKTQMFGTSLH